MNVMTGGTIYIAHPETFTLRKQLVLITMNI